MMTGMKPLERDDLPTAHNPPTVHKSPVPSESLRTIKTACLVVAAALALSFNVVGNTFHVSTPKQVADAARHAVPGDDIVLAEGTYPDLKIAITAKGDKTRAVRVRAGKKGKTVLTGSPAIDIRGSFVKVEGLAFRNCVLPSGTRGAVVFDGAASSSLEGCSFQDAKLPAGAALITFRNGAHDCLVASNTFSGTRYKSVMVVVDDRALKNGAPVRNRIAGNVFKDIPPLRANGAETIQIGQRAWPHSEIRLETIVENNHFFRCNGEAEIISIKASGNIVRSNLFRDNNGELVIRHGHFNTLAGNHFEGGSGGIRVSGHGNVITANTIRNCRATGIRLYYGTPDLKHPASYLPVYDCLISSNLVENCAKTGILVGDQKNAVHTDSKWAGKPWFASAVQNCTIAPHNNTIFGNTIVGQAGRLLQLNDAPNNSISNNVLRTVKF